MEFSDLINSVQHMEALKLMQALPDASIDALISDFPYNTTANEWENGIALTDSFWREVWRIVTFAAPVITTASQPFTSLLTVKNLKQFRHEWIWEKTRSTGYLNANIAPMKTHENILVFSQCETDYYPQMERGIPYRATSGAVGGHIQDKSVGGYITVNHGLRYPKSVLRFHSVNGEHPSEKPVDLYEYLIKIYTLPDMLVLDPFMGSGTTCVAARNLGRRYIGGDITPEYVEMARKRLDLPYTLRMFE